MKSNQTYSLREIQEHLKNGDFPFSGTTQMGSAEFHFLQPSWYAGIAIHAGNNIRNEILSAMKISRADRYREEDPYTERFIRDFPIRIIARDSRFEYDINRDLFGDVIDDLLFSLNGLSIAGHPISVGENVVFKGGGLSRRLSPIYYDQLLILAVEFKKIFMDEWSGRLYEDILEQLADAFSPGVKQVVTHPFLSPKR